MTEIYFDRIIMPAAKRDELVALAMTLREQPTASEALLWDALRARKLDGVRFRRQQPLGPFVVDFLAADRRLIVEVDGPIHDHQREADRDRQAFLESLGFRFVRVTSGMVERDLPAAIAAIRAALALAPPSPLGGRGCGGVRGLLRIDRGPDRLR